MAYFNRVILLGNLTKDPELHEVGDNTVCNFTLASTRVRKTKTGEKQDEAMFINLSLWGPRGVLLHTHAKKGHPLLIEGVLRWEKWLDKDGKDRGKHVIEVERFCFLQKSEKPTGAALNIFHKESMPGRKSPYIEELPFEDDLPF